MERLSADQMLSTTSTFVYTSPLGSILIKADDHFITKVHFMEEEEDDPVQNPSPLTSACAEALHEYFEGKLRSFEIPVKQEGTEFQLSVWRALMKIEFGKTENYFGLSKKLGNTKAIRAVGAANGKNNIAIIVPCHRVIGTDGSLVGYAGGLWRKKWLLEHEARLAGGLQTLF